MLASSGGDLERDSRCDIGLQPLSTRAAVARDAALSAAQAGTALREAHSALRACLWLRLMSATQLKRI